MRVKIKMPVLLALLTVSIFMNVALIGWVLIVDTSNSLKIPVKVDLVNLQIREHLATVENATQPPSTRPPTPGPGHGHWDSPASSCQATRGSHGVNITQLQMFTNRLKTFIPSDLFDRTYKTPCWYPYMRITEQTQNTLYKNTKLALTDREASAIMSSIFHPTRSFVCVPKLYFMGFPRSGSTQLYKMLVQHPRIKGGLSKEPHWWTKSDYRFNFPHDILNVVRYITFFQSNFEYVRQNPDTILVDGSQSTIWDTRKTGNLCFLPQLFSEVFPAAKYIVMMRDPIQRMFSDFNYLCETEIKKSKKKITNVPSDYQTNRTKLFHERALTEIRMLEDCLKTESLEYCTHRRLSGTSMAAQSFVCGHVRLGISLYHVHIKRWLREIPRAQFLFLQTADMAADPHGVLKRVWNFLGVAEQNVDDLGGLLHEHLHSSIARESSSMGIGKETEALLRKFFQPHNDALAELLGDDRFRWSV